MIDLARANAAKKGLKPPHVAFIKAQLIETLPIESNSVDCILSNCVVNLLPLDGKAALLKEMHRILKPGGRIVLDDVSYRPFHNCFFLYILRYRSWQRNLFQIISRTIWHRTWDAYPALYSQMSTRPSYTGLASRVCQSSHSHLSFDLTLMLRSTFRGHKERS